MALIHGSCSTEQVLVSIGFYLAVRCSAMNLEDMDVALGKAVERALIRCEITIAQACGIMRIQETHFRSSLRGEGYRRLQLNHLIKLGPVFMVHLTGELMWLTAKQRATEILETVSDRKRA